MKHSLRHQTIYKNTVFKTAVQMFNTYFGLKQALIHYKRAEYKKGAQKLMKFIKQNKNLLHLEVAIVKNDLVSNNLNDYQKNNNINHSVIRNEEQLRQQISILKRRGNIKKIGQLTRLVGIIKKKKRPLLIIDDVPSKKKFLEAIIHELNAWFISGCGEPKKGLECMVGDWRRFLPKDGSLKRLDEYFLKKNEQRTQTF